MRLSKNLPPSDVSQLVHQALLSDALLHAATAAFVLDDAGHYIAVNDAACDLTGYSREELVGLRAGRDLAGDEPSQEAYPRVVRARRTYGVASLQRRDGEVIQVRYLTTQTTVSTLPYVLSLCWQEPAAVGDAPPLAIFREA